jgi:elongator complex protein 2
VRLWRIAGIIEEAVPDEGGDNAGDGLDMLDEFERKLAGEAGGSVQISTKAHVLSVESDGR